MYLCFCIIRTNTTRKKQVKGGLIMIENFGKVLIQLRKERNLAQQELCDGLCSLSAFSRLELGEREPDYFLFDALFTRLGKDSRRGRMIVTEQEQQLLQLQDILEYALRIKDWDLFETKMAEYGEYSKVSSKLHKQYFLMLRGKLFYQKGQYKEAMEKYQQGLLETNRYVNDFSKEITGLFSRNELRILCLLGQAMSKLQEYPYNLKVSFLKHLYEHIHTKYTDRLYRFAYEVFICYCLADLFYDQGEYVESALYCEKAMEELIVQESRFYMKKIVEIADKIKEKGYVVSPYFHNSHYLLEILEEWSIQKVNLGKDNRLYRIQSNTTMREIIKNTRKYWNKTQEELIGMEQKVLNQTGISQIETGKREPRKRAIEHCFSQLWLTGKEKRYHFPLQEENFHLQEQSDEIERYLGQGKYKEAKALYDKIKGKINTNNSFNRQWIEKIEILLEKGNEKTDYHLELIDILEITIPKIKEMVETKREFSYYMTEEEANIYMNIGCSYHDQGMYDEAEQYYKQLMCYYEMYYPRLTNKTYIALLFNYSSILGLKGQYDLSMEKSNQCIRVEIQNDLFRKTCRAIFNLAWCYGKKMMEAKGKEKKEEYRALSMKYFEQAFFLGNLLGDKKIEKLSKMCCEQWGFME